MNSSLDFLTIDELYQRIEFLDKEKEGVLKKIQEKLIEKQQNHNAPTLKDLNDQLNQIRNKHKNTKKYDVVSLLENLRNNNLDQIND